MVPISWIKVIFWKFQWDLNEKKTKQLLIVLEHKNSLEFLPDRWLAMKNSRIPSSQNGIGSDKMNTLERQCPAIHIAIINKMFIKLSINWKVNERSAAGKSLKKKKTKKTNKNEKKNKLNSDGWVWFEHWRIMRWGNALQFSTFRNGFWWENPMIAQEENALENVEGKIEIESNWRQEQTSKEKSWCT